MPEDTRNPGETGDPGDPGSTPPENEPTRPPVSPDIDWRARALEAESQLAASESALTDARTKLSQVQADLAREKQARVVDRALAGAGVIDTEVASLMLDSMLASRPDAGTNIAPLIEELRTTKPFLFESSLPVRPAAPSVMSAAIPATPADSLNDLAEQARATGDRRSLLRYLRARRAS